MFSVGMLVLYDKRGVYQIESVGTPPVRGASGGRYYKLCAVFSSSSETIYTPVDAASSMRLLISGGEAAEYLELFSQLEPRVFRSGRAMDVNAHYRDMLASRRIEDCLLLIKEIHVKQQETARQKKRPGQVDVQYLKLAEKLICEEFAVALGTTPESIRQRLYAVMQCRATA